MISVSVMQPYLFPHIAYFQLLQASDYFVVFDDVNFIKKGWINRNSILLDGRKHNWSLPLAKISQNKKINEHEIFDPEINKGKLLSLINTAYVKAPYYPQVMPLLEGIILNEERNIAFYIENSLKEIAAYLDMDVIFKRSSDMETEPSNSAQDRLCNLVKVCGGQQYINPIGGQALYAKEDFAKNGVDLHFLEPGPIHYQQGGSDFVPSLSMIDVLMFNSQKDVQKYLKNYRLI